MGRNVAIDVVQKLVINTEYSDPLHIAEFFNRYFSEIGSSLDDSLLVNQQNSLQYVSRISNSLILFQPLNVLPSYLI